MKGSRLPPFIKGTTQLVSEVCKISEKLTWLQLLQVEPRLQILKMTSKLYFQNGLLEDKQVCSLHIQCTSMTTWFENENDVITLHQICAENNFLSFEWFCF